MTALSEDDAKLDNFLEAFRLGISGSRRECVCGKTYYDPGGGWDWEEGEMNDLEMDTDAVPINCSVGVVKFEGQEHVDACDCWHQRARRLIAFIDGHADEIALYLTLEKQRLQERADNAPVVGGGELTSLRD